MAIKPIPRSTNNTDYTLKLRDLANLKGLDVGYNQDTKAVSVGGQPFDTTGWQNIGGYNMGTEAMANDFLTNYKVPTGNVNVRGVPPTQFEAQTPNVRQDPTANIGNVNTPIFSNEINNVTKKYGDAVNNFGQAYDVTKDPIYNALADYQERRMLQLAGRTGSAYDSNTQARIGQANMQLGLQFQQNYDARQLQNIQNLQGQLNTLTGLEDRAMVRDNKLYGMDLSPVTRDYMTTMQNLTPEQTQYVSQYSDNFAGQINNLPAGDPRRKLLEAGRFQKVIGDPVTYRDYLINDYGLSPFQVDNMVMAKKLKDAELKATNQKEALELQKLYAQVEKANYDTQKAGIDVDRANVGLVKDGYDTQQAYYDTIIAQIKATALPKQLKADLENTVARTRSTNLASQLTQKKINDATKGSSPKVYQGFNELVAFAKDGGTMLDWLSSMRGDPDRDGASMGYRVSETYTPDELTEISKLAKSTGILSKEEELTFQQQVTLKALDAAAK
jgi:hypothetical protein